MLRASHIALRTQKSINLYTGFLLPTPPESLIKGTADVSEHRLSDHVAKLIKVQSLLIEIARDNQLSADSFHMKEASPLSDMFPVNSYVLLKPHEDARVKSCECQRPALILLWVSVGISTPYRTYLPTK